MASYQPIYIVETGLICIDFASLQFTFDLCKLHFSLSKKARLYLAALIKFKA